MTTIIFMFLSFAGPKEVNLADFELFSPYLQFAISQEGQIMIANQETAALVFLDQNLEPVHHQTSQGSGPDEVARPGHIYWDSETETFWMLDYGKRSFLGFKPDGSMVGRRPYTFNSSSAAAGNDGTWYYTQQFVDKQYRSLLFHYKPAENGGEPERQEIFEMDIENRRKLTHVPISKDRKITFILDWDVALHVQRGSNFLVCNKDESDTLVLMDLAGTIIAKIDTQMPRMPVTAEHLEEHLLTLPEMHRANIKKLAVLPDFYPAIMGLLVNKRDEILVYGAANAINKKAVFRIYDKSGKQLRSGKCTGKPIGFANNDLYWLEEDEDGERFLKKAPLSEL